MREVFSGSDEELYRRALAGAAHLVANFGDEFLPAYKCLEEEVRRIEQDADIRARALELARSSR